MGPCIIMLQHEVMVVDEWHNNGPRDLVTVSICIQKAINKMHLCSLSITLPQLSGWLVSDDLGVEDAGCGGPGLVWL